VLGAHSVAGYHAIKLDNSAAGNTLGIANSDRTLAYSVHLDSWRMRSRALNPAMLPFPAIPHFLPDNTLPTSPSIKKPNSESDQGQHAYQKMLVALFVLVGINLLADTFRAA